MKIKKPAKNKHVVTPQIALFTYSCLMGFFVLSSLGSNRLILVSGFFLPEPFMIAYVILLAKNIGRQRLTQLFLGKKNIFSLIFVFFLVPLGLLRTNFDIVAVYGDFRCIIVILFVFCCCSSPVRSERSLLLKSVSLIISFSLLGSAFANTFLPPIVTDTESVKQIYPVVGVAFLLALYFLERNRALFLYAIVMSVFIGVTSFYRTNMFLAIVSVFMLFIFVFKDFSYKRIPKSGITLYCILLSAAPFALYYIDVINIIGEYFNSSESRKIQSLDKLQNFTLFLQTGQLGDGDDLRWEYLKFISDNFFAFLLPSGLGHRAIISDWGPLWTSSRLRFLGSNSIDGLHLYLACHFGILATSLLALVFARHLGRIATRYSYFNVSFLALLIVYLFASFAASGNTFSIISSALSLGAVLALLHNMSVYSDYRRIKANKNMKRQTDSTTG